MFVNGSNSCFITLKYHKPIFLNSPKVRLLNPAKNELGTISKSILDGINTSLQSLSKVNQWKNTSKLIEWFKNIGNKQKHKFILFDIKDFSPRITKELFTKCSKFAEEKVQISNDDRKIVYHCKKVFNIYWRMYVDEKRWFIWCDVGSVWWRRGMWTCWDFLLDKISEKCDENSIGLYRDNRLSVFKNKSVINLRE